MTAPRRKSSTQEEFFAWDGHRKGRFEFDGFQPVAMTGGGIRHAVVMRNLHRALDARLAGTGCQPVGPDAGVATIGAAVRYPDAVVTCSLLDLGSRFVPDAMVIFEILSASTSRTDRIDKVREYAAVASVRRYVIVESTGVGLSVLERDRADETWRLSTLTGDDILRMPEIGIELAVGDFYDQVAFDPMPDEPAG